MRHPPENQRQDFCRNPGTNPRLLRQRNVAVEQPLAPTSGPFAPAPVSGARRKTGDSPADQAKPPASLSFQDEQTLAQLRHGDWSAMEQVVTRYQDRLFVTILRMVNHADDAADLVQETFVRAMQGVARFEGKSTLYTWLFRIALNLAISHRRTNQYRSAVSLDAASRQDDDDGVNRQAAGLQRQLPQETEDDPAVNAQRHLEYERLQEALARLDPEFKAVIVLRDVEECDYDQIAAILEVPVGTIKSRLFRARNALRDLLKEPARRST
jgi:RNA polymerase sigma-70 factor, ECF subfamily